MKSLSKITLFAALTAVTATACQKEDNGIDTSSGKLVKMTLRPGTLSSNRKSAPRSTD